MTVIPIPTIYLDTNICRDCIKNRSKTSKDSIHLLGIIKDRKWKCITSAFTIMELYDIEKDDLFFDKKRRLGLDINRILQQRRHKDLSTSDLKEVNERISDFFEEHNFIKFHALEESGWDTAKSFSQFSNISAADSIHLAVAWGSGCNVLVTSDQDFINETTSLAKSEGHWNEMRICKPDQAIQEAEEIIKIIFREQVRKGTAEDISEHEDLRELMGIGPVTLNKLINADIYTVSQLKQANALELAKKLGFDDPEIAKNIISIAKLSIKKNTKQKD